MCTKSKITINYGIRLIIQKHWFYRTSNLIYFLCLAGSIGLMILNTYWLGCLFLGLFLGMCSICCCFTGSKWKAIVFKSDHKTISQGIVYDCGSHGYTLHDEYSSGDIKTFGTYQDFEIAKLHNVRNQTLLQLVFVDKTHIVPESQYGTQEIVNIINKFMNIEKEFINFNQYRMECLVYGYIANMIEDQHKLSIPDEIKQIVFRYMNKMEILWSLTIPKDHIIHIGTNKQKKK
eukprot:410719_1